MTLVSVSFKERPELDEFVKTILTKVKGQNLILAPQIREAITNNEEMTNFCVQLFWKDDRQLMVSFGHNPFKVELLSEEKDPVLAKAVTKRFCSLYESLC